MTPPQADACTPSPRCSCSRTLLAGACPIVGSYRAKDLTQRGAAEQLKRALRTNGVEPDIKEYPDAGHSFLNDYPDVAFRIMKIVGIGYREPSASTPT